MIRRLLVSALIAVLAAAAPVAVAYAGAPAYLKCAMPGKDGKPGGGGVDLIPVDYHGGMAGAVKVCLSKGGHPAGVSDGMMK